MKRFLRMPNCVSHLGSVLRVLSLSHLRTLALLPLLVLMVSCSGLPNNGAYRKNQGFVFGTYYNIIYRCDSDLNAAVLARLAQYDKSMSVYNDSSLLSQLNRSQSVEADSDMLSVLTDARLFYNLSHGAFDVTVEPLSRHWRFTRNLVDDTISVAQWQSLMEGLDTVMPLVGMDKIRIEGRTISKTDPRMLINANALAEGRGIDMAAEVLRQHGVTDFMVELGGEINCAGHSPRGGKWNVGIDKPIEGSVLSNRQMQHVIQVSDCAVSTSGSYRQCYHVADGRTVQHTIDPRTGKPVTHNILSVTVVGPRTTVTDALCTSIMVVGPDSAFAIVDRARAAGIEPIEAYYIYTDSLGQMVEQMTDGFRELILVK